MGQHQQAVTAITPADPGEAVVVVGTGRGMPEALQNPRPCHVPGGTGGDVPGALAIPVKPVLSPRPAGVDGGGTSR